MLLGVTLCSDFLKSYLLAFLEEESSQLHVSDSFLMRYPGKS